jgi:mycofactocin system glycosyltransferase
VIPPQLAPGVRRPSPELLVGGSPLRALRLTPAGAAALDALLSGLARAGTTALRRRLLDAGMLLLPSGPPRLDEVTVVVPARASAAAVRRVLAGVPAGVPVVVVPDEGEPPRGPAATRNLGAAQAATDLIAFVDTGVHLPPGCLERLSGHFGDERVVAVAPRVVSDRGPGAVGVLEHALCALDQGSLPGEVRPGAAVSYVPSAVLLVRREALTAVGGFDEQLDVGEDVDLVWRLADRGVVRYDPEVVVHHAPRTSLVAALRRRFDYGTAAGPLDSRHPARLRHLRMSWWSLLPWAAALVHPLAGPGVAGALVAASPRRLGTLPPGEARRVAAAGQWSSFCATGRYTVRPAWPLTAAALLGSRRARRLVPVLAAAYVAGSFPRLRGPARELPLRVALHLADDVAYSSGVWRSALRSRRWRVLVPGRG